MIRSLQLKALDFERSLTRLESTLTLHGIAQPTSPAWHGWAIGAMLQILQARVEALEARMK